MCWLANAAAVSVGVLQLTRASAATGDLYPRGNRFCFTFYSIGEADAVRALAAGATAIGPYYGNQREALKLAAKLNTKLLYKVEPPSMSGIRSVNQFERPGFVWPPDATISNEIAAVVNAVQTNAHIAMWDIEPEELRSWKPEQLHYLKLIASAIRTNDPLRRPVYMYECNNRGAGSLSQAVEWEDLCTKGTYVNEVDRGAFTHHRIWARWSMEQEINAVARGNPAAVPWIVLWMAADPAPADFELIPRWCRHDAYLVLILGGKGIFIWSAARNRADFSHRAFDAYLEGYLSVARDLNGPLQLAPVFLFGKKNPETTMTITSGPKQLDLAYQNITNSYPPISFLSATHATTNYLFVVNSAEQPVTATFSGLPATDREDLFAGVREPTVGGSFSLTLPALVVKAFRFAHEPSAKQAAQASMPPRQ